MVDAVNSNSSVNSLESMSVTGLTNINLIYAQLQMELSETNKDAALNKIETIKEQQEESKRITDAINALRSIKTDYDDADNIKNIGKFDNTTDPEAELATAEAYLEQAKELQTQAQLGDSGDATAASANKNSSGEKESTMMTKEMEDYFIANDIDYDDAGVSARQNSGEWDRAIKNLENRCKMLEAATVCDDYGIDLPSGEVVGEDIDALIASLESAQEEVGSSIQQEMVFVQDFMGQYNSYTQGASSAISKSSDTLTSVATGR